MVMEKVGLCESPAGVDAAVLGVRCRGQVVTMYEFDESREFRRFEIGGRTEPSEPRGSG